MKKITLILAAFILTGSLQAQINYGVKAGLNYSGFNLGEGIKTPEKKLGSHIGAFAQYGVGRKFMLKAEFLYSLKGYKAKTAIDTFKANLHYVNLPLLVGFKTKPITFLAGVELGYLFQIDYSDNAQYAKNFNKEDLGLIAGVQVSLNKNISIESRYVYGIAKPYILTQINRDRVVIGTRNIGRNETLQLSFVYSFSKKPVSK